MKSKAEQSIRRIADIKYRLILEGTVIGILAGLLISMFRLILAKAESFRATALNGLLETGSVGAALTATGGLLLCFFCAWICIKTEPMYTGSGIL